MKISFEFNILTKTKLYMGLSPMADLCRGLWGHVPPQKQNLAIFIKKI